MTTTTLTQTTAAMIPANDLPQNLFVEFVAWIDRGEKTTRTYLTNLRQFIAWMKYRAICRPTRQDIISYRDWLTAEHEAISFDPTTAEGWKYRTDRSGNRVMVQCKANTVKLYLQSVRQFFRWTASCGYYPNIAENLHTPKLRQDTHKKEALAPADVLTIENSIIAASQAATEAAAQQAKDTAGRIGRATEQGKRLQALYLLAVNAGLRTVELSRANVKDITVKNGAASIMIWGKGHSEADQKKPLAPEVYEAIRDYLDSRADNPTKDAPLFVATGNRSGGKRLAPTTISTMLKKAMQQAGYDSETLTAHSLRHTAGTCAMEVTGDLYLTQQYMRHSNPATTEIYLHVDTERQEADTARRLYDHYHGKTTGDTRQQLAAILDTMTPQQLEQMAGMAAAITR